VLQLGIAKAVGEADEPVALAKMVLAAIAAIPLTPTPPHAGALDAPVETMACPELDPAGLRSCIGTRVAALAPQDMSIRSAMMELRIMVFFLFSFSAPRTFLTFAGENFTMFTSAIMFPHD
jgi:hypothetical protein